MTSVLAIDPGAHATGYAYFTDDGVYPSTGRPQGPALERCGLIRGKTLIELAFNTAAQVRLPPAPTKVILERPQAYQRRPGKTKGDPNDLILIAIAGGVVLGTVMEHSDIITEVELVRPAEWKGQVPKEISHRRMFANLTKAECAVATSAAATIPISLRHNCYDGIALGLWALGRSGKPNR